MAHPSDSAPMLWLAPGSLSSRGRSFWILVFTCITCDTSSPCVTLVQLLGHIQLFVTPGLQHARLPCPSPSPGVCSNSRLLSKWYNNHCIIILLNYNNFFFFFLPLCLSHYTISSWRAGNLLLCFHDLNECFAHHWLTKISIAPDSRKGQAALNGKRSVLCICSLTLPHHFVPEGALKIMPVFFITDITKPSVQAHWLWCSRAQISYYNASISKL